MDIIWEGLKSPHIQKKEFKKLSGKNLYLAGLCWKEIPNKEKKEKLQELNEDYLVLALERWEVKLSLEEIKSLLKRIKKSDNLYYVVLNFNDIIDEKIKKEIIELLINNDELTERQKNRLKQFLNF